MRILRGFTLVVDDNTNLALEIEAMKLPTMEEMTESFMPGGGDVEIDITGLGTKAFALPFKLKTHSPSVMALYGGPPGLRRAFTGKKLVIDEEDGSNHEHAVDIRGRLAKIEGQEMTAGKAVGYDNEVKGIWDYTEYWDGRVMYRYSFKLGGWQVMNFEQVNTARTQILFS
ncbi:MAG TPA: phage tail protein [Rhizobium sp.]|nr:phage tail protein [Rhizobium sp.]